MKRLPFVSVTLCLSIWVSDANSSEEIRRNPFARPPTEILSSEVPVEITRQADEWRPELRAVLVAGQNSVADLGGDILRIGESTHGYRLLSVNHGIATFDRSGEKVVLSLYEQEISEQL